MPFGLAQSGNGAEQVLHRAGIAGEHMGLELGDADDHIRLRHGGDDLKPPFAPGHGPVGRVPVQNGAGGLGRGLHAAGGIGPLHGHGIVGSAAAFRDGDLRSRPDKGPCRRLHHAGMGGGGQLRVPGQQQVGLDDHPASLFQKGFRPAVLRQDALHPLLHRPEVIAFALCKTNRLLHGQMESCTGLRFR